jgi:hypothetical protein
VVRTGKSSRSAPNSKKVFHSHSRATNFAGTKRLLGGVGFVGFAHPSVSERTLLLGGAAASLSLQSTQKLILKVGNQTNNCSSNNLSEFLLDNKTNQATMRFTVLSFLTTVALANAMGLKATSEQGKTLLGKARKLTDAGENYGTYMNAYNNEGKWYNNGQYNGQYAGQYADQNSYQQNYYGSGDENDNYQTNYQVRDWGNNNANFDTTWITGYSIKFAGCAKDDASGSRYDNG